MSLKTPPIAVSVERQLPDTSTTAATTTTTVDTSGFLRKDMLTTKGDLITATGLAAQQRLAVGTDGQVLTADSVSSVGVSWQTLVQSRTVNNQTGTTYTVLTGDRAKLVTISNGSAIAVTLPQAGVSFPNGWFFDIENRGAGASTITPTTSTIDGAATLVLSTNQGCRVFSDGTNYFTQRGAATTGAGGTGAVSGADTVPTVPNGDDDEFNSATLNVKWTAVTTGTPTVELHTRLGSCLGVRFGAANGSYDIGQTVSIGSSSNFSYTAKITGWNRTSAQALSLYVCNAGNTTRMVANFGFNSAISSVNNFINVDSETTQSVIGAHQFTLFDQLPWLYLTLQRIGNGTWSLWWSFDGVHWFQSGGGNFTRVYNPAEVHLAFAQNAATVASQFAVDWVRRDWIFLP